MIRNSHVRFLGEGDAVTYALLPARVGEATLPLSLTELNLRLTDFLSYTSAILRRSLGHD